MNKESAKMTFNIRICFNKLLERQFPLMSFSIVNHILDYHASPAFNILNLVFAELVKVSKVDLGYNL